MKHFLVFILLLTTTVAKAQLKLEQTDLSNLISIGELYSRNTNAEGDEFVKSIESLRTPKLNRIVDALITVGKRDKTILENRFLARPDDEELVLWYVIREIHYSRTNDKLIPRPDTVIANEILSNKIDSRWLLDNYYYRLHGGIASMFNDADLSKYNFNMDSLGFKDETEKAIFFLNITNSLIGGRSKVLRMIKNHEKLLEFFDKLPKFNGKDYFYYKNFDYDDFDWIGYDKTESYNESHIGDLYSTLLAQLNANIELGKAKAVQEIYYNSILHEPKYFKFTTSKEELQFLYDETK